MDADDVPRRAARADLHLLPSGARPRRAGRAHAADARRPHHRGDRARLPRPGRDDGEAPRPREAEDQGRRDPVPRAPATPATRPARRGARRRLPDLQRGLRRPGRPRASRRSGSAGPCRADAGRAGGARAPGADAPQRRAPRRALRRRRRSSSSRIRIARCWDAEQIAEDAPRSTARWRSAGATRTSLQAAIAVASRRRSTRTGRRSRPSTASSPAHRLGRRGAEPGGRDRGGGRRRGGAGTSWTAWSSSATTTSTRPVPSCFEDSAASTTPAHRTTARWSS